MTGGWHTFLRRGLSISSGRLLARGRTSSLYCCVLGVSAVIFSPARTKAAQATGYAQVRKVFAQHCIACHDSKQAEGKFVVETFSLLMKGGDDGPVVLAGKADESPLLLVIEHKAKPYMPPKKAKDSLTNEEIALVRGWIEAGAPGPADGDDLPIRPAVVIPKVEPKVPARRPIRSIAYRPQMKWAAVAQDNEVRIISVTERDVLRRLLVKSGNANTVAFSSEGSKLAVGAGEPGVSGEIDLWNVADGTLVKRLEGHADAVYSVAISPDGKTLASGSYDNKIILWDIDSGKQIRALDGHNGAILGLAFRPDGAVLASASADRTVKLWDVKTGARLDTFAESLKELNSVAFTPDGQRVVAAGGDNRIRQWQISSTAKEGTNRLLVTQFASEGSILRLAVSAEGKAIAAAADDGTVKLWDSQPDSSSGAPVLKELRALPSQPDWPAALAFGDDNKLLLVGRLDGSLAFYDPTSGAEIPPPKPELTAVDPIGIQRGETVTLHLTGKHLSGISEALFNEGKLWAKVVDETTLELTSAPDLKPGTYDLKVASPGGQSGAVRVYVDDLPQVFEQEPNDSAETATLGALPADFWGKFDRRGDVDYFAFEGKSGQTIVLDAASQRLGSKANLMVEFLDASGRVLSSGSGFDNDREPLLAAKLAADGRYFVRVTELEANASAEHFYRLSIGSFAYVSGCYPLAVAPNTQTTVRLVGLNCPDDPAVTVHSGAAGEGDVPLDPARFRWRKPFKVMIGSSPEPVELEPNDHPSEANPIAVPGSVNGRIDRPGDVDLFRFEAKAGGNYVVETLASRRGSPVDTKIEVLHPDGSPVPRVQLAAVRDSAITFRAFGANATGARLVNWEEMDLNQFLYMQGEVVKLFLAPRGPDSEYGFYTVNGRRKCYFDTTATAHALDEHCYIVEAHKPGESVPANGLPVFVLNYQNDDEGDHKLGSDSRLLFTAPADGSYLVRVTDARGFGGERYAYRLTVRPAAPDFAVSISVTNPSIPAGTGKDFAVSVDRIDGYEGPVRVDISGVPPGFVVSTPLTVEAGHAEAKGTLYAMPDAPASGASNTSLAKLTATAVVNGKEITRRLDVFGKVSLAPRPALLVGLDPATAPTSRPVSEWSKPAEITVVPGQFTPARLWIARHDFKGEVTFEVDNLPHGVIVADIGLNGVLINENQNDRQIFLHTAPWVAEQDRLCYARAKEAGSPTSMPVLVHVRKPVQQAQGK